MRYPVGMRLQVHFAVGFFLCAMGAGCDKGGTTSSKPAASAKISILVTVYPVVDMVQRIGGQHVNAEWLIESGQRPEEIEAGPELRRRMNKANLVVTSGRWDLWASAELTPDARSARIIEPERTPAGRQLDPKAYPWLDPAVMHEMIEPIRMHLSILDPTHETDFTTNAAAYRAEVEAVDLELRQGLNAVPARQVLAVRPVWGALCKHFGLSLLTPVDATERTLRPGDFREIARVAKEKEIKTIFVDSSTSTALRQEIEDKTGLKTVELDAMGSSAADGRNTWAKLMRFNLEQLKKGLK